MALKKIMTVATVVATLGVATVGGSRLAAQQSSGSQASSAIQEQDRDELIEALRQELRKARTQIAAQSRQIEKLTERLDQLQASSKSALTEAYTSTLTEPFPSSAASGAAPAGATTPSNGQPGMGMGRGPGMSMGGRGSSGSAGQPDTIGSQPGMPGSSGYGGMSGMMRGPGMGGPMPGGTGGAGGLGGGRGMMGGAGGTGGPGAMAGMMGGMPGSAPSKKALARNRPVPFFLEGPDKTIITTPGQTTPSGGEQVKVQHSGSGEVHVYSVNGEKLLPLLSNNMLALQVEGPEVTHVAVYDFENKAWSPMRLKEPVKDGKVSPVISPSRVVYYLVGRRVYAFSGPASRWDVLTLDEDAPAPIRFGGQQAFLVDNHLHTFNAQSGRWEDIEVK